jgi:hypothetical protein
MGLDHPEIVYKLLFIKAWIFERKYRDEKITNF